MNVEDAKLLEIPAFLRRPLALPDGVSLIEHLRAGNRAKAVSAASPRRYKMPSGKSRAKKTVSRFHAAVAKERAVIESRVDEAIENFGATVK